uniref:Acyl-CoA oxidase C-terminal domain-containing protein n=1 Tax=Trypanosoma vivax (strain Y486) TaxID=1055687 RepID=G0TS25_TRYVY|nr:conserved hypothetical protein [Trypanosoma vivax Y486]
MRSQAPLCAPGTIPARFFPFRSVCSYNLSTFGAIRVQRRMLQPTSFLRPGFDPTKQMYQLECAFEEPTFRFICEGVDMDYRQEVREAVLSAIGRGSSNFTGKNEDDFVCAGSLQNTLRLLRATAKRQLISFAQVKSTPRLFHIMFETIATCNTALSLIAADHFTFAAMVATNGTKEVQAAILDDVDSCRIIGAIAHRELVAEGAPLNTEARYDKEDECFVLRGAGKFAVVAGACADWAIVTATLTLNKSDNRGTHAFVVQLRENGVLKKGISVRPMHGEHVVMSASGVGVIHFDNVRIPLCALMLPARILDGEVTMEGDVNTLTSLQALTLQLRLSTASLYAGTLKRFLVNVVRHVAGRVVVGPDGLRNHPLFGIQHVQTQLVKIFAKSYVYLTLWRRVLSAFTDSCRKPPSYEDEMKLSGVVHFLQESLLELSRFSHCYMGVHASLDSTGDHDATLVVHLRQEGLDQSALIREVAHKSVLKNIGTTHWGWQLSNVFRSFKSLDRLVKNPFYSPRIADLGRHLIFFGHKHYREKKQLRRSRDVERRKGGKEHQWYDWVMFRHEQVLHCGEAYVEMVSLDIMMDETQKCTDPRARKLLRDIGWIFALARQQDRLDYFLTHHMLTPTKSAVLGTQLDNLATVFAPQCVNLVDAFQVPKECRAPCAAEDMERYWTIPGTDTWIQRGDKMTVTGVQSAKGNSKTEQEQMKESDEDVDLLHGLADEPSFVRKE